MKEDLEDDEPLTEGETPEEISDAQEQKQDKL